MRTRTPIFALRRDPEMIEPERPTAQQLASRVKVPSRLKLTLAQWRGLQRQYADGQDGLRCLIAEHHRSTAVGNADRRESEIRKASRLITDLASQVGPALADVKDARPEYVAAIDHALEPLRDGLEQIAAAGVSLAEIAHEIELTGGDAQRIILPVHTDALGDLRRRLERFSNE
jgi:hypothetical protein